MRKIFLVILALALLAGCAAAPIEADASAVEASPELSVKYYETRQDGAVICHVIASARFDDVPAEQWLQRRILPGEDCRMSFAAVLDGVELGAGYRYVDGNTIYYVASSGKTSAGAEGALSVSLTVTPIGGGVAEVYTAALALDPERDYSYADMLTAGEVAALNALMWPVYIGR